ncbi:MAG: hypothetical protein COB08_011545 [Rhodobacteraceae bacterium]|nr:hypothetical protein [Paracoccaceae bacterium]
MLKKILILMLALWGPPVLANPENDAAWFMTHFVDQRYLDGVYSHGQWHSTRAHREALLERGVIIVDDERFAEMLSETAIEETVQRLKSRIATVIIESYGPKHLSEIADFFRTPLGGEMLLIAEDNDLFEDLRYASSLNGAIHKWKHYLSPIERIRYMTFTNSPAGQVFVNQTWAVRTSINAEIRKRWNWPDLPLNRPYIVEILKADGIALFPNPIMRRSLIRELSATNP